MSNTKSTPGPWKVETEWELYEHNRYYKIESGVGFWASSDQEEKGFTLSGCMSEADAHLIAAAPELLEAGKIVREWYEKNRENYFGSETPVCFSQLLSAINKASAQ